MLAKHLAPRMNEGGSFVIFSGVAASKIAVGTMGVAITNAAADTLARSLALELAPIRVNAISPGVIDTGAWDAFGEQGKADYFARISTRNPARRIGTPEEIAQGVPVPGPRSAPRPAAVRRTAAPAHACTVRRRVDRRQRAAAQRPRHPAPGPGAGGLVHRPGR
jgi:NAD(P)-dependent dehydrogenase (short-subunit alcohol dehydrogenase family)